jgi:hypothetical protein
MANDAKPLRCAIYTRKSTEHGLEQEFNSLDAHGGSRGGSAHSSSRAREPLREPILRCQSDGYYLKGWPVMGFGCIASCCAL